MISWVSKKRIGVHLWTRENVQFSQTGIDRCRLLDMGVVGSKYTWRGRIYNGRRIDFSDHHPLLLSLHGREGGLQVKPFRFERAWICHQSYTDMVTENWQHEGDIKNRIGSMRHSFIHWKRHVFGNIHWKRYGVLVY